MRSTLRTAATVGAIAVALVVSGCSFSFPKPPGSGPTHAPTVPAADMPAARVSDAPALLIQCLVDQGVMHPRGQDWLSGKRVRITSSNAQNFTAWWQAYFTPGPYRQTFVIDGHRTHYLAFGAHWTLKNGQWVPMHRARNDPLAQRTSLYAWSHWAAAHDALPAQVCEPGVSPGQLQTEVFGKAAANPWSS